MEASTHSSSGFSSVRPLKKDIKNPHRAASVDLIHIAIPFWQHRFSFVFSLSIQRLYSPSSLSLCCSHTHAHRPAFTSLLFLHNEPSTTLCWTVAPESSTAVSPVTGGCFAFVDRLRCCYCCCSYGLLVAGAARVGAGWAPSSRPPRLLQHRLERSSSVLPSRLLEQGSQRESPHGTQLKRPALELAASGNLSVGLVLLRLEHPLLAAVHLLAVPVRQALMLILGSLSVSCLLQDEEDEWGSRSWAAAAELTEGERARPAHMAPPLRLRSCSSSRSGSVPPAPFMCSPPSSCARSDRERRSSIQAKKISNCFFFNSPRTAG
ncbi:uncharacterized protein LOC125513585 isoform X3 [Triticum urartu]|uniref:uncharacterized protein LOC125513585 isoform X3 n=1 Tax=Triticum urartu TaxID=4572 RepID=UPI002043C4BD|nr:uncharacterized protein LOC125513585 isoform X3 [Triticum urartu]